MIKFSFSGDTEKILSESKKSKLLSIQENLYKKTGEGSDFLGWLDWPSQIDDQLIQDIESTAKQIRQNSDVLIVIGIGGSYLGAKAVIEALSPYFKQNDDFEVLFAGHHVSGEYLKQLIDYIDGKQVTLNVISKSGTTTEPAIAFRFLKKYMEERYGKEANSRIIVTTDANKGALLNLSKEEGYKRYVVPDDIGGRYSVFTPVGLLPIAAAGIDIRSLLNGAKEAENYYRQAEFKDHHAMQYAATRHYLYEKGYSIELTSIFEPKLSYILEWWKQLFGESEGKEHKGIFPASVTFTTDLHSLGQYIQDGKRQLFETFLMVENAKEDLTIFEAENDGDELNYLAGLSLNDFNQKAYEGTSQAHQAGEVPVISLHIEKIDEYHLGYLLYFYMISCAYSAYLLDVNPFDQPGVEAYKQNIFKLLNKPGY